MATVNKNQIDDLPASKITTGTFADARISESSVTQHSDALAGASVSDASTTTKGIVELATSAETTAGTDATRAVTPDGLQAVSDVSGMDWTIDEDNMFSDSATQVPTQQSVKAYVDSNSSVSVLDAKGKIATYSGLSSQVEALSVGTDGQVLTANSAEDTGMIWSDVPAVDPFGVHGVNVQTLTGNITITSGTDKAIQHLDPDGTNRFVTLADSGSEGDRMHIRNTGSYNDTAGLSLFIGATFIGYLHAGRHVDFVRTSGEWAAMDSNSEYQSNVQNNVSQGRSSIAYTNGTAIGANSEGYNSGSSLGESAISYDFGVGVGRGSNGADRGVSLGYQALGRNYGVGLGYYANSVGNKGSVALGARSKTTRASEVVHNIDYTDSSQDYDFFDVGLNRSSTDDTEVYMYVGGESGEYLTVNSDSVMLFTAHVTGYDDFNNKAGAYILSGCMKSFGGSVSIVGSIDKTVIAEEEAGWDCNIDVDTTNDALRIKVKGVIGHNIRWVARVSGVETKY